MRVRGSGCSSLHSYLMSYPLPANYYPFFLSLPVNTCCANMVFNAYCCLKLTFHPLCNNIIICDIRVGVVVDGGGNGNDGRGGKGVALRLVLLLPMPLLILLLDTGGGEVVLSIKHLCKDEDDNPNEPVRYDNKISAGLAAVVVVVTISWFWSTVVEGCVQLLVSEASCEMDEGNTQQHGIQNDDT